MEKNYNMECENRLNKSEYFPDYTLFFFRKKEYILILYQSWSVACQPSKSVTFVIVSPPNLLVVATSNFAGA